MYCVEHFYNVFELTVLTNNAARSKLLQIYKASSIVGHKEVCKYANSKASDFLKKFHLNVMRKSEGSKTTITFSQYRRKIYLFKM